MAKKQGYGKTGTPDVDAKAMTELAPKMIANKIKKLKGERGNWESQWEDINELVLPRKENIISKVTPGEKKGIGIYDNTAIVSNELLAGAMHGMLTNTNSQWFEFTTGDIELDMDDEVRKYLQGAARKVHAKFNGSNFQTEVHEFYLDLGSVNTANMLVEEVPGPEVIRFSTKFIRDYFIDEDYLGRVNQVYREWKWSAYDLIEAFGYDNMPEKIRDCHDKGKDETFCVIHAVYPETMLPGYKKKTDKPIISQYVLPDLDVTILTERFFENPYVVSRWAKASGEKYGRGPGMSALPEVRTLNKMAEVTLRGAQKVIDPPLQLPDDGFIMPIRTKPGGLNYYRAGTNDFIRPVFNDTRIDFGFQAMQEKRNRVREAFYVDQLTTPVAGPQRTATEVMQRAEEQMRLMGPVLGRQETEFLKPLVDRVFGIMNRRNEFGKAPAKLQGKMVNVRYISTIAKTQRISEANSIMRVLSAVGPIASFAPQVLDNFNADAAARSIAQIYGLPQEILRSIIERDEIRTQREQAQAQQAQAAQTAYQNEQFNKTAETITKVQEI